MIILIFVISIVTLIYFIVSKKYQYWNERGVKHNKPVPFLGDSARNMFGKESVFFEIVRLYNSFPDERYVGMYLLTHPALIIRDPDLAKMILVKDFDHFVDHRELIPDGGDPLWTRNLFALKGSKWKHMRATLSPTFTSSKMKMIFTSVTECIDVYVNYFSKKQGTIVIELRDTFSRYTNDVIASIAFGLKCDSINERDNEFYKMGKRITSFGYIQSLIAVGYLVFPKICKALGLRTFPEDATTFFTDIIIETIKIREEKKIHRPDIVSLLLDERKQIRNGIDQGTEQKAEITDLDIAAQAYIFFFAGFDTVSTALVFLAYELIKDPSIQRKLQEEIDVTCQECNGEMTYDALMKMKYMDMVVSETLRIWPPGLGWDRVCAKSYVIEPTKPGERRIELQPGDLVWVATNAIQRDAKYFPDPLKFDPERFSDENKTNIKPYTYMPFGNGPRICIGSRLGLMEIKAFVFQLLLKFDFVPTEKTQIPLKISNAGFDVRPEGDFWIGLKPRKK